MSIIYNVAEPELEHFGRSRCKDPAPGSTLEEILNDILFVRFNIDKRLNKKYLKIKEFF